MQEDLPVKLPFKELNMARTFKRLPTRWYRRPKGFRQAKIHGVRRKAIPPNDWEDICADNQCYLPYKIAFTLHKKGFSKEIVIKKLRRKFNLKEWEARRVVGKGTYWWKCDCNICKEAGRD